LSDPNVNYPQQYPHQPEGTGIKFPILFGAIIALVGANIYLFLQLDKTRTELAKMQDTMSAQISSVRETSSVSTQTAKKNIENLQEKLEAANRQAAALTGQAKSDAIKKAEELSSRLESAQKQQEARTAAQFAQAKEENKVVAGQIGERIGEVKSEVGTVKTDLASTKTELDKTIAGLKSTTGELGVQTGLIATNGRELLALKQLGERNYFEFNLKKSKQMTRVGDITMQLKKTDDKKNKYTIEIVADDKRVEKKDKTVNEPIQLYVAKGGRIPYEIVVNTVKKDNIVGYLATPKVGAARN
jgi:F0F1-type ATP synthase membrane subunit b/b'